MYLFVWKFLSFLDNPGVVIAVSHGNSIFSFLRNLHTVFHTGCTNLHFHQQCSSTPSPSFVICAFMMMAILTKPHCGFDFYFSNSSIEHLFVCMLVNVWLIWRNVYVFYPFFDWVVFVFFVLFLILSYMNCLYILEINPLLVIASFANIFYQYLGCIFILSSVLSKSF